MTSPPDSPSPHSTLLFIAAFEGSLVIVAVAAGWIIGVDPSSAIDWSAQGLGLGILAVLPLVGLLFVSAGSKWRPFRRIRETVDTIVDQFFREGNWIEIATIAALAGLGEEMLFRGVVQYGISEWIGGVIGATIGLIAGSILFGAGHAVHTPYFILTTLMGVYFGGLFLCFENLVIPIIAHGLYDFIAIVYLRSRLGPVGTKDRGTTPSEDT